MDHFTKETALVVSFVTLEPLSTARDRSIVVTWHIVIAIQHIGVIIPNLTEQCGDIHGKKLHHKE